MSDKYQFKTPHVCVVCSSSLVEEFEIAYPQPRSSRGRVIGFNMQMRQQRLAEPLNWYPKSLGIMCPKCKIKYELPRKGYTEDQVRQRMMYIAVELKDVQITPLAAYEKAERREKREKHYRELKELRDALQKGAFDSLAVKKGGLRKRLPTAKDVAAAKPVARKVKPATFSGVLYLPDEFFRANPGSRMMFALCYTLPKGCIVVYKKLDQKFEQAYVITEKDYKKAKKLNREIIDILKKPKE